MTLLLIVGLVAFAFTVAISWADSRPPVDTDEFTQSTHCRVVDGGEL